MQIILMGNVGVGKGTQAQRISAAYSIPHISTGHIFRNHIRGNTDIGKEVRGYIEAGQLVPDELTCRIVADRTLEADCTGGYILDGFPRSVPQAEEFERVLGAREANIDLAINLELPDDEIIERLTARRSCPTCGAIYNLRSNPPAQDGQCDNADCVGGRLIQRKDDTVETIRKRLDIYYDTTKPILAFYGERGILRTVDAAGQSPDGVFAKIEAFVSQYNTVRG